VSLRDVGFFVRGRINSGVGRVLNARRPGPPLSPSPLEVALHADASPLARVPLLEARTNPERETALARYLEMRGVPFARHRFATFEGQGENFSVDVGTGDRVLVLLGSGNLALTQSVVSLLDEAMAAEPSEGVATLLNAPNMYRAARVVGDALREGRRIDGAALEASKLGFSASFIFGGQIKGERPRLFQIYPEGNFIEATDDTPFLQIGEHKYGKPILDRVARADMRLGEAAKLMLLSFDSTLRSNLSVGMPIDVLIYERDSFNVTRGKRVGADDEYFRNLSSAWSEALRQAVSKIEEFKV